jgi:hypothetical protein
LNFKFVILRKYSQEKTNQVRGSIAQGGIMLTYNKPLLRKEALRSPVLLSTPNI